MNTSSVMVMPMCLGEVLGSISISDDLQNMQIGDLRLDSRKVSVGDVFVAVNGLLDNGENYISDAFSAGAIAVLVDDHYSAEQPADQIIIAIEKLNEKLPELAAKRYPLSGKNLHLVGVTGTNGKSSCVSYIAQLYSMLGYSSASIGTLGYHKVGDKPVETGMTTPDVFDVYRQLALWQKQGVTHIAMEVSSHGLDQHRVDGVPFTCAVFTNLSRDHLDYHGNMQNYAASKAKLFSFPGLTGAVINSDDAFGQQLGAQLSSHLPVHSFALIDSNSQFCASNIEYLTDGMHFFLSTPRGKIAIQTVLYGEFNIYNLLAAIAVVFSAFDSLAQLAAVLKNIQPVVGRMQMVRVSVVPDITVVVDYAHTPDALARALASVRKHCSTRLIVVFGCGGDRDSGKRPMMAKMAEQHADYSIVTDDNPRTENSQKIIDDICQGFHNTDSFLIEQNRSQAIAVAIDMANKGDVIFIAGKGHENYQLVNDQRLTFSDYDHALSALTDRAGALQ